MNLVSRAFEFQADRRAPGPARAAQPRARCPAGQPCLCSARERLPSRSRHHGCQPCGVVSATACERCRTYVCQGVLRLGSMREPRLCAQVCGGAGARRGAARRAAAAGRHQPQLAERGPPVLAVPPQPPAAAGAPARAGRGGTSARARRLCSREEGELRRCCTVAGLRRRCLLLVMIQDTAVHHCVWFLTPLRLPKPSTAWRLPSSCMYTRPLYASRATGRHTSAKLQGQQACPCCHSLHGSLLPDPLLQSGLFTRCAFVAELCPAAARAPRS
jgi:hypothetical protein